MSFFDDKLREMERVQRAADEHERAVAAKAEAEAEAARRKALEHGAEMAADFVAHARALRIPSERLYTEVSHVRLEYRKNLRTGLLVGHEILTTLKKERFADCWRVAGRWIDGDGFLSKLTSDAVVEPGRQTWWSHTPAVIHRTDSWERAPMVDFMTTTSDYDNFTYDDGLFSEKLAEFLFAHRN